MLGRILIPRRTGIDWPGSLSSSLHSSSLPSRRIITLWNLCNKHKNNNIKSFDNNNVYRKISTKSSRLPTDFHRRMSSMGGSSRSRSERRAFERKQRKKERRKERESVLTTLRDSSLSSTSSSSSVTSLSSFGSTLVTKWKNRMGNRIGSDWFHGRVVGSGQRVNQDHTKALIYRLPLVFLFGYIIVDSDFTPYKILPSLGPSMLPTIQFLGDIWLVETGQSWRHYLWELKQQLFSSNRQSLENETTTIPCRWKRGDVVLWKDSNTGRISCKRIVGLPGEQVDRYGTYASMYQNDSEGMFGIRWPKTTTITITQSEETFTVSSQQSKKENQDHPPPPPPPTNRSPNPTTRRSSSSPNTPWWDPIPDDIRVDRKITIPLNYVWLEGDCPLFSYDSRQYGPIPMKEIYGRLMLRVWPLTDSLALDGVPSRSSLWLRKNERPIPFPTGDDYLGKRFNFHRISRRNNSL